MICKFDTCLLLFYYYKLECLCLRDVQAVCTQGSIHVKPTECHVCHNAYITFDVINNMSDLKKKIKSASPLWSVQANLLQWNQTELLWQSMANHGRY